MLIRQSVNAYIRFIDSLAYIENQVNHVNHTFFNKEKEFLSLISRKPQRLESIVTILASKNINFENNELEDFIAKLEFYWFIVTGESESELNNKDVLFTYSRLDEIKNSFTSPQSKGGSPTEKNHAPWLKSLELEITSLCNERCIHCFIPSETKKEGMSMPLDQIKLIIDSFVEMSGLRIILSGGELFIHKDIIEVLKYCREKDLMIFLHSNITLIDDNIIQILKSLRVFNIQVSLYSMDEQVHDNITKVKGSWRITKQNLEALVQNNIPVMISCPILKQNYKGYKDMMEYAKSLNIFCYVDYVLLAQNNFCTGNLCTRMTLEQTGELLDDMLDIHPNYVSKVNSITSTKDLDTIEFAQRFNKCDILKSNICISVDGNVYPCPGWQNMIVGNIHEQSLHDIWTMSPKVKELRNIKKSDFKKCAVCNLKNYCDMCMVYNYNEHNGDIYSVCERFCEIAKLMKQKVIIKSNLS